MIFLFFLVALALVASLIALALHFVPVTATQVVRAEEPESEEAEVEIESASVGWPVTCGACENLTSSAFTTQITLDMPLLDSEIGVTVHLCEECLPVGA